MSAYVKLVLVSVGGLAAVYGLMSAISPNPEELKKKLPEHNPQHMRSSQDQARALNEALKKAANNPDPLWKK